MTNQKKILNELIDLLFSDGSDHIILTIKYDNCIKKITVSKTYFGLMNDGYKIYITFKQTPHQNCEEKKFYLENIIDIKNV
ncbi:MAG: hypothetical protein A2725_02360 [Candidatus Magasanikbacteria bacterium RIFCSPHIGHO2_01_FULL_33_34]|uniref:Uncharacterized protein n=1 Tax=Candidatus Magasanikbacteria bacterium RIFCSPHIGHO2_01_FULL_33_34 TaxID=1798671 RepID=A0A1F6LKF0_9BACT|nr:MAG: hypothetical protein A2725_02360 [Candidatus Magasanikbacteria bacterium RIFCSPHIGHO2_01_FULL_33_34]OGH65635.1 MAG: hypothetical protein A3B83_02040 [Candidatus Magasanikbacteria bacterium RIFCSPHIGHO2_02_FULL_33_17]OGH75844.1 MAG: hypothetical protein A3A89_02935 [Candidatus Magasanikbacteria bacterium RIFCSPLOWO2_01_FULL_33_34]OGH81144.1 MAG: hypothetical protein A3F93_01715 [Candidatus Magasanikbacteria bacterium RIFCSPLOWO2_12_FULL_34_7]